MNGISCCSLAALALCLALLIYCTAEGPHIYSHGQLRDDIYAYGLSRALVKVAPPAIVGLFCSCPSRSENLLRKIKSYMIREAEWREKKLKNDKSTRMANSFLSLLFSILFLRPVWSEEEERKRKRIRWIFVHFCAWHYIGCDKLWAGLVVRLFKAIQKDFGEVPLSVYRALQFPYPKKIQRISCPSWKSRRFLCLPLWSAVLLAVVTCIVASIVLYFSGLQIQHKGTLTLTVIFESIAIAALGLPAAAALRSTLPVLKNLICSQSSDILRQMNKTTVNDQLGFMNKVRKEVAVLVDFIHFMENFEGRKIRVVLEITSLDRCSPDKAMQMLEAINILLAGENAPFVSILAVDPYLLVRNLENSVMFYNSQVSGYELLNQIVTLPFSVPEMCSKSKCLAFKRLADSHLEVLTAEETEAQEAQGSQVFVVQSQRECIVPFLDKTESGERALEHALTWEIWAKQVKRMTKEALEYAFDEGRNLHSYLPGNSTDMRRIINSVRVSVIVMEATCPGQTLATDIVAWVVLANNWPCRLSWIQQCLEDWQQYAHMDGCVAAPNPTKLLWEIFADTRQELRGFKGSIERLLELDEDPELFEGFLKVDFKFSVHHIAMFKSCTVNLDYSLQKELSRLRETGIGGTYSKKYKLHQEIRSIVSMQTEDICFEMERLNLPVKCQKLLRANGLNGALLAQTSEEEIKQILQMTSEEWRVLHTHLLRMETKHTG